MRILALDLGEVRVGVARSDLSCVLASPLLTYKRKSLKQDIEYYTNLIKENNVNEVVIGLPINMDGTEGYRAEACREVAEKLKERNPEIKIILQDERLTTVEAEEYLIAQNMKREQRKKVIDQVAASIILQTYLDKRGKNND